MKTIRGILIDPIARAVTEVQLPIDDGDSFNDAAHKVMECEIYTIAAHLPGGDIMLVDDEGLLTKPDHFFHTTYYPGPLAGKALIVGNTRSGNTANAKTKLGFDVLWMSRKDTRVFQENQERVAEKLRKQPGVIHVSTLKDFLGDD